MDRLEAIRLFVRLVECGNFSAVGRAAGIGQPAVSKRIVALERHLGVQLVLRTSRQVVITEAGLTFYESAKQLVDDFDAVESSVGDRQQSPQGVVRLNTAPAHGRLSRKAMPCRACWRSSPAPVPQAAIRCPLTARSSCCTDCINGA